MKRLTKEFIQRYKAHLRKDRKNWETEDYQFHNYIIMNTPASQVRLLKQLEWEVKNER